MNAERLLLAALAELEAAVKELLTDTFPKTPLPRFRRFEFVPGELVWPPLVLEPCGDWKVAPQYVALIREGSMPSLGAFARVSVAKHIVRVTGGQPRLILRALRRIQAAAAWCRARAEGRRRMAEEILRQQARAAGVLEAEATIMMLSK